MEKLRTIEIYMVHFLHLIHLSHSRTRKINYTIKCSFDCTSNNQFNSHSFIATEQTTLLEIKLVHFMLFNSNLSNSILFN